MRLRVAPSPLETTCRSSNFPAQLQASERAIITAVGGDAEGAGVGGHARRRPDPRRVESGRPGAMAQATAVIGSSRSSRIALTTNQPRRPLMHHAKSASAHRTTKVASSLGSQMKRLASTSTAQVAKSDAPTPAIQRPYVCLPLLWVGAGQRRSRRQENSTGRSGSDGIGCRRAELRITQLSPSTKPGHGVTIRTPQAENEGERCTNR